MTRRDRVALTLVAVVAAVVGAWLLVLAPERDQAGRLAAQIRAQQAQLRMETAIVDAGAAARRRYAGFRAELTRLGEAVPADDSVPALIVEVQRAAGAAGVDFRSLVLDSGGTAATPSPSNGGASAPKVTGAALPPGVTIGPAGLPQEPFTLTFTGSFFRIADFLGRLQRFVVPQSDGVTVRGRLMTLNAVSLSAGPGGFPQLTATVSATTYLLPAPAATSPAPAGAATPVPASTPSTATTPTAPPTATVTP